MKYLKLYALQSAIVRKVFLGGTLLSVLTSSLSADILHTKTDFYKKLEAGQTQKLVVVGTSVSVSGYANYWPERLAESLNSRFQYNVYYQNLAQPSTKDDYLVATSTQNAIAAAHPDVVIYEVCTGVPTSNVAANLRSIIHQTRVNCPNADIMFWCPWPTPNHTNMPVSISYDTCTPYMLLAKQIAADSSIHWVPTWPVMDSIYRIDSSPTCYANRNQNTYNCPLYSQYLWDGYHPSIMCVSTIIVPWMLKTLKGLDVTDTTTVAEPVCTPNSGTYFSTQNVSVTCVTSGATIYYTTDGTQPTQSSSVYSTAITIDRTITLKAQAFKNGKTASPIMTQLFTIKAPTPTFSPLPGGYKAPLTVSLSALGSTIRYTTDGTDPTTTHGTLYSTPVSITSATAIKAMAISGTKDNSKIAAGIFFVSDSVYSDTTTLLTGVANNNLPVQSALIPCLFDPSTWNRLVLKFDFRETQNYGSWVGFTLFDQGPKMDLTKNSFPTQCLVVGHTLSQYQNGTDGTHNLSTWKMKSSQDPPSKMVYLQRSLPITGSGFDASYEIVFNKLTGGAVEWSTRMLSGTTEIGTIVDTINSTQWASIVAAKGKSISVAGCPYNGGMRISIKNIVVSRTSEIISMPPVPVKEVSKKTRSLPTGITQSATGLMVRIAEPGAHQVTIYDLRGSVLYCVTGSGEHLYSIPQKQLAQGIYFVKVKTAATFFTQTITKCAR